MAQVLSDLTVHVPVVKIPQPDGSLLLKPGRPQVVAPDVSTTQFHKETGLSIRHIETLCEQGLIKHRRLSEKPRSRIRIPRAELERYKKIQGEI